MAGHPPQLAAWFPEGPLWAPSKARGPSRAGQPGRLGLPSKAKGLGRSPACSLTP